jgi:acyl carrier protein
MTARAEVLEVLRQAVREVRPTLAQIELDMEAPLAEGGLGLDSVAMIELIGVIETRLDFLFDETQLRVDNFASLGRLADVVHAQLARGTT